MSEVRKELEEVKNKLEARRQESSMKDAEDGTHDYS
jgi:hypothetical protein